MGGILIGSVQLISKDEDTLIHKVIYSCFTVTIESMIMGVFVIGYLLFCYGEEDIVYKYNQHLVREAFIGVKSYQINYYEYQYILRSTQKKITEVYKEYDNDNRYTIDYDENGNIKENTNKEKHYDYH